MASQQISSFDEFTIQHVPREQNTRADLLSKLASTKRLGQHQTIIQETLHSLSLDDKIVNTSDSEEQGWMTCIWSYLKAGVLPVDKDEARKMRLRLAKFVIVGDELFKRGISTPLLKCLDLFHRVDPPIHMWHPFRCTFNGAQSTPSRILLAHFEIELPRLCTKVQRMLAIRQLTSATTRNFSPDDVVMPFSQWGMDILGPFPPAKGQLKFLLVAIDYFTKWIEACPLAKITSENIRKFTWKNIVCRFGIPHSLVTDNSR
uniref:Integrase catalytic domain-containing protein n=1 Tax=Cajanus cajan TaxID=3821 RepID=A0A151SDE2_CAJCA|nr:hypothetical protein KK1_025283 [Cajanus cajan]